MNFLFASNPFLSAYFQSDLFGKLIFIALFLLSIGSWSILVYKVRTAQRLKKAMAQQKKEFQAYRNQPLNLSTEQKREINPFVEIYTTLKKTSIELLSKNKAYSGESGACLSSSDVECIGTHLDTTIMSEANKLEKHLFILATTAGLAPLLGLLGTVWGILLTLSELQVHRAIGSQAAMLGGLSMALATTVLGLVVAIPALIGYNYLRSLVREMTGEMEEFSSDILASVELHYRAVDVRGA